MAITIKQNLVATSKYPIKCPNSMTAEYITVHNTYNDASAENEIKYMITNNNQVSFHVAVDDVQAIQGIPFNRNAWACGDGNGSGNRKSISIEICYSKSGGERYVKAEENSVQLIAQLLRERGWDISRVKKHQDWSGKYCPHRILDEGRWSSFLSRIEDELKRNVVETKEEVKSPSGIIGQITILVDGLNIRSGAGKEHPSIGRAVKGRKYNVTANHLNLWMEIIVDNQTKGWVSTGHEFGEEYVALVR